jgi:hypothetical protein
MPIASVAGVVERSTPMTLVRCCAALSASSISSIRAGRSCSRLEGDGADDVGGDQEFEAEQQRLAEADAVLFVRLVNSRARPR